MVSPVKTKSFARRVLPLLLFVGIVGGILFVAIPKTTFAQTPGTPCSTPQGTGTWVTTDSGVVCKVDQPIVGASETPPPATNDTEPSWLVSGGLKFISAIAGAWLSLCSLLLWLAGTLLEFVIDVTIRRMGSIVDGIGGINIAWRVIRDVLNISFIFILLYTAIKTIIDGSGINKQLVGKILMAALLINFSLFFTKVFINISNNVTYTVYSAIKDLNPAPGAADVQTENGGQRSVSGIAGTFMQAAKLTTVYNTDLSGNTTTLLKRGIISQLMGSIFVLILAFVFIAITGMLAYRFIILLILLIVSPVAAMTGVLPQIPSGKWWNTLSEQLIFAPALMVMLLVTALVVTDPLFAKTIMGDNASFGNLFAGTGTYIGIILNFIIVIGLALGSLMIAKMLGGKGGDATAKWGGKLTLGAAALAGTQTLGRLGRGIANSDRLKQAAAEGGFVSRYAARGALQTGKFVGGSTFDVRGIKTVGALAGKPAEGGVIGFGERRDKANKAYKEAAKKSTEKRLEGAQKYSEKDAEKERREETLKERARGNAEYKTREAVVREAEQKLTDAQKQGGFAVPDARAELEKAKAALQETYEKALADARTEMGVDVLFGREKIKTAREIMSDAAQKVTAIQADEARRMLDQIEKETKNLDEKAKRDKRQELTSQLTQQQRDYLVAVEEFNKVQKKVADQRSAEKKLAAQQMAASPYAGVREVADKILKPKDTKKEAAKLLKELSDQGEFGEPETPQAGGGSTPAPKTT